MGDFINTNRIAYLDGIRTLAIVAVLGVHWAYPYVGIGRGGYIGVDLFFVLSGFIITSITWDKQLSYGKFLIKRVRRLYPALIGVVAFTVPLTVLLNVLGTRQAILGGGFALIQANSVVRGLGLASTKPFDFTWSLSAEWIFYIVWPLLIIVLLRRVSRSAVLFIVGSLSVLLYFASVAVSADWFYFGFSSRGAQMLSGAWLAVYLSGHSTGSVRLPKRLGAAAVVVLLAVVGWVILGSEPYELAYRLVGFPLATTAGLVLIAAGRYAADGAAVRFLAMPWMAAIGRGSYSLYLWHTVPIVLLHKDTIPLPTPVIGGVGIAAAVLLTWLSFRFLEKPFMKSQTRSLQAPIIHARG